MHSIFKIGISQNMKCAYMVGFLKYSHICNGSLLPFKLKIFYYSSIITFYTNIKLFTNIKLLW